MNFKSAGKYFRIQSLIKEWIDTQGLSKKELIENFLFKTTVELKNLKEEFGLSDFKDIIFDIFPSYVERTNLSKIQIRVYKDLEKCICLMTERISTIKEPLKREDIKDAIQIILCLEYAKQNPELYQKLLQSSKGSSLRHGNKKTSSGRQKKDPYPSKPFFHVMGEKSWFKEEFIKILSQCPDEITDCIDIFGGSGYLTELAYFSGNFENITYNDDDMDKQNFFDIIQKKSALFKVGCMCNPHPKISDDLSDTEKKIVSAVNLFWKSRNQGISIMKELDALPQILEVFNNVKRTSQDGVTMVHKYRTKANCFFIVDPPYLNTRGYKNRKTNNPQKDFCLEKHKELAEELLKCKGIFLYFCRVTAPRDYTKPCTSSPEDARYRGRIENLFANHNLYFHDFAYKNHGTIERVITNYPFHGFSEFKFE